MLLQFLWRVLELEKSFKKFRTISWMLVLSGVDIGKVLSVSVEKRVEESQIDQSTWHN